MELIKNIYPIIIAILFFELIIIVHEAGHCIVAKINKIKVEEFAVGMGPKLFQFKVGETKYSLRLVLFGGYCKMEGEEEDSDSPSSFSSKSTLSRMAVVFAGAFNNLVLGFLIVLIIICSQNLVGTTTVAKFDENAISSTSLKVGDQILSIDGMRVYTSTDIMTGLSRSNDSSVIIKVKRNGKVHKLNVEFDTQTQDGKNYVNMDFWLLGKEKTFSNVIISTFKEYVSYVKMVFLSIHDMLVGRYGLSDVSGPVGAVSVVSSAVKTSLSSSLRLMALLTVNVGLLNLFPIPALDGWLLFTLIGEGIFKKKLSDKVKGAINMIGFIMLISLMCIVTFSDISKLI